MCLQRQPARMSELRDNGSKILDMLGSRDLKVTIWRGTGGVGKWGWGEGNVGDD